MLRKNHIFSCSLTFLVGCHVCIIGCAHFNSSQDHPMPAPKAPLIEALEAIQREDRTALGDYFTISPGNTEGGAWLSLLMDEAIAIHRLHRISLARFGRLLPTAMEFSGEPVATDDDFRRWKQIIVDAPLVPDPSDPTVSHVTLNQNILDPKNPTTKPAMFTQVTLKKIDTLWKIDANELFPTSTTRTIEDRMQDPETNARQQSFFRELLAKRIKACDLTAKEIEANRYKSLDDANDALKLRL